MAGRWIVPAKTRVAVDASARVVPLLSGGVTQGMSARLALAAQRRRLERDSTARRFGGSARASDTRGPRLAAARDAADARVRRARDDPVPTGQGPGLVLRRLRAGGGVGGPRVRHGPPGPAVHPAPRPGRAPDSRRDAN